MAENEIKEIEKLYRQYGNISHQELFRSLEKLHKDKDSDIVIKILAIHMAFEYLKEGKIDFSKYNSFIPKGVIFRSEIFDTVHTELMTIKDKFENNPKYEGKFDFNFNPLIIKSGLEISISNELMEIYNQCGSIADHVLIKKIKDLGVKPADFNVKDVIARQMAADYLMYNAIIFSHFNDVLPEKIQEDDYDNWVEAISCEFESVKKEFLKKAERENTSRLNKRASVKDILRDKRRAYINNLSWKPYARICNTEFNCEECKNSLKKYFEERGEKKERPDIAVQRTKNKKNDKKTPYKIPRGVQHTMQLDL